MDISKVGILPQHYKASYEDFDLKHHRYESLKIQIRM